MSDQIVSITSPTAAKKSEDTLFPSETINLPSKGWFYPVGHVLSSGTLDLKPMTTKEEDILTSKNLIQKGIVLDKLLSSLIVNRSINPNEFLSCDRNAAFIAIRRMAYGDSYKVNLTCPKCGIDNSLDIDLGKMDNKEFDFENHPKGENRFEFILPVSKKTIYFKMLTKQDEDNVDNELKSLSKISGGVSSEISTRLKTIIIEVDGNIEKPFIRKFVDQMRAGDSLALRNHVRTSMPDVDMSFDFTCNSCGLERKEDIPIGVNFFWPNG